MTLPFQDARILADGARARALELGKALSIAVVDYGGFVILMFTASLGRAYEFIDRSETGQVTVNLPASGWNVHHPFRGFHDSGSPFKEQGAPGLRFYTRVKTAAVRFES